jgi:hypothetical protein
MKNLAAALELLVTLAMLGYFAIAAIAMTAPLA